MAAIKISHILKTMMEISKSVDGQVPENIAMRIRISKFWMLLIELLGFRKSVAWLCCMMIISRNYLWHVKLDLHLLFLDIVNIFLSYAFNILLNIYSIFLFIIFWYLLLLNNIIIKIIKWNIISHFHDAC